MSFLLVISPTLWEMVCRLSALRCLERIRDLSAVLEDILIELGTETCEKKLGGMTALASIRQERMEKLARTCDPVTLRNILAGNA